METEGVEQEILLQPEMAIIGAVYSVNGYTGHVVLKTSDLENDSGYQTSSDVMNAISTHNTSEEAHPYIQGLINTKQDILTAGTNIQISEQNVISATDTTYSAGNGINISGENAITIDTTVVATQQNLSDEVTNRENADIYLQQQIDGISASSDVVDIVGTYAELQQYDTQHLKDNDIIKVLQDETQGGATTYYRWSTHTSTFTLIGQEGPYYTKAAADAEFVPQTRTVNSKALSANIVLTASDVSALGTSDVVQTTGSSTSQVMSQNAVTTQLATKLDASAYVVDTQLADSTNPVQNKVLYGLLGDMPSDFFSGTATSNYSGTSLTIPNALSLDDMQILGDTTQQTYSGKNLFNKSATPVVFDQSSVTELPTGVRVVSTGTGTARFARYLLFDASSLVGKTITLSSNMQASASNTPRLNLGLCDSTGNDRVEKLRLDSSGSGSYLVEEDSSRHYMYLNAYCNTSGTLAVGDYVDYTNIQLEIGTATSYEPYTGSTPSQITPSPNPDYPQTVNVVTGTQNVWVHGKNLFNKDTVAIGKNWNGAVGTTCYPYSDSATRAVVLIPVQPSTTYSLSLQESEWYAMQILEADSTYNVISVDATQSNTVAKQITTSANTSYIGVKFKYGSAGTTTISQALLSSLKMQLELGSSVTSYEPTQTFTIDLGSTELCKIGTYQDKIYTDGTDWYVHKATGKSMLGGLSWTASFGTGNTYCRMRSDDLSGLFVPPANNDTVGIGCSNYFTMVTNNGTYYYDIGIAEDSNGTRIWAYNSTYNTSSSANDFKTWLQNNNVTLYYALTTPTDTKITDNTLIGQLEAVLGMSCYAGNTYVEITASDLAGILDLTAINANANGIIYKLRGN